MKMPKEYICNNNKYFYEYETIALPVSFENLPQEIEAEGYTFILKSSFHVSLVCIGKIIEKHNITIPDFENSVIKDFCEFIQNNNVSLERYTNEFRFVQSGDKKSIIAMCEISNLDKFFELINKRYGANIEMPPTHATLYTLQPNVGIFVTNSEDLQKLTKMIKLPQELISL